ncbi:hypothetical protein POM88_015798 [Heracleum sosnowskyi]|uniref:Uncharacterized protein n=1 Tax=Heracleum sosnowskyi TaxID=360622 RepID=A0AAD8IKW8_9APIA|nr:hypothetical protein POM88_015798 [Heracleum sosnowskyi]
MAENEGSIKKGLKQMISFRVPWTGPKSKKSKGKDQGRSKKTSGGGGEAHKGSDEESYVKGSWEEKERLENKVNNLLDCGYRDIDIKLLNPHYFSQRTWNAICDHWGTPQFAMRSELGQKARLKLEFTSRTGAIPYEQRREEIDEEREEKGEMSITDEEFLTMLYDPNDPAVKDLQPPSPRTQMEIYRIKDIISTMQARPLKKGRIILHPQDTVGELIGAQEATRWTRQPKIDNSHDSVALPDKFYQMMLTILDVVR